MATLLREALGDLDVRAFGDWLIEQPWNAVVGIAHDCSACPLARWLSEMTGAPCEVWPAGYQLAGQDFEPWSGWAERFVEAIDRCFVGSVSANSAFMVLTTQVLSFGPHDWWDEWRAR